jgi:DNA-binding transcriptional LysR family regulator
LEVRNLTVAAEALGLTQSAMSRQLVQLREQLGDPLLVREGQRYLLTTRAEGLRGPLRAALGSMDAVLEAPSFEPTQCTRQFVICGSDYIATHMVPELVKRLTVQAPRACLFVRPWEPDHYRQLADEGVDIVPAIADVLPDNLHGRAMGEDKPVCLMRAAHPLAQKSMTLEEYAAWPHLRISGGSDKDSFADLYLLKHGLRRDVRFSVPFFVAAVRILAESDLILTVPEHIAVGLARETSLVWQALPFDVHIHQYWLLWHARNHHDAAHQWFRNQVFDVMQESMYGINRYVAS